MYKRQILDIYDCNKAAKDYLEFFLNPDVGKLRAKFDRALFKELKRSKWGNSKARISVIRRLLKDFLGFQPGAEAVHDAMLGVIVAALAEEHYLDYPKTMTEGVAGIMEQMVDHAFANGLPEKALADLDRILAPDSGYATGHMRRFLTSRLNEFLAEKGIHRSAR